MHNPMLLGDYMVKSAIDYWTVVCYPTLYFVRCL